MERFSNKRSAQGAAQQPARQQAAPAPAAAAPQQETFSQMANVTAQKSGIVGKLLVISLIVVSVAVTAFVAFAITRNVDDSDALVKSDQYQALFLTDGQIYFGKLSDLDKEYVQLQDIYYLQVNQQVQPNQTAEGETADPQSQISLAKLGSELHGPEDQMFVNKDQILFWENLKDDGQVVTAITEFVNNEGN